MGLENGKDATTNVLRRATAHVTFKDGAERTRSFWTAKLPAHRFFAVIMHRCKGPNVQGVVIHEAETFDTPTTAQMAQVLATANMKRKEQEANASSA